MNQSSWEAVIFPPVSTGLTILKGHEWGEMASSNKDVVCLVQLRLEASRTVNLTDDLFPEDSQHQPAVTKVHKTLRLHLAYTVSQSYWTQQTI